MMDKRLMYAQGKRVGFEPGGMAGEHGMGAGVGADGTTGGSDGGYNDGRNMANIAGPVTSSFTDADDKRESRITDQYTTGPTPTDPEETTINELTTPFAPKIKKTIPQRIGEFVWDTTKKAATLALLSQTGINLSPTSIMAADSVLGFTNDIGKTKSSNLKELGINTLGSIGDLFSGNTNSFSGITNTGINTNSFSGNTNSFSNNNLNNNGEGGQGNADQGNADQGGVLSNEYILLLQKMQLGNFTQEEQTRFNLLKTMLGK